MAVECISASCTSCHSYNRSGEGGVFNGRGVYIGQGGGGGTHLLLALVT